MTASVPQNGNGGAPPQPQQQQPSLDASVKQGVEELILDAIPKARGATDGVEFAKWAQGINLLLLGIQPKPAPAGPPRANDSAQTKGPAGKGQSGASK